ncbi:MAG TPA: DUF929 family protein [Nocardioidaceae bacterium]|nr:DUF929 family protein [Nocardioidaceae bacterium]
MAKRQATKANERAARAAAIREQQARRSRRISITITAIVAIIVVVIAFVVIDSLNKSNAKKEKLGDASPAVANAVTGVPASVFAKVGKGALKPGSGAQKLKSPPLTGNGKPKILYVGADYCPFCAAERWALTAALGRFGTFEHLGTATSSANDYAPNTATLSYHGASYSSQYIEFAGYEQEGEQGQPLDTLPEVDMKLYTKYDAPPYTTEQNKGSIPFIDIGGKYVIRGASYDPIVLQGMTHEQIAKALSDPNSKVAQNAIGAANMITAAICKITDGQPANVCTGKGVTEAASLLGKKK